jgi:hypothetical protein
MHAYLYNIHHNYTHIKIKPGYNTQRHKTDTSIVTQVYRHTGTQITQTHVHPNTHSTHIHAYLHIQAHIYSLIHHTHKETNTPPHT